jgi:uncharacterized Tic20 family protein
MFCASCGTEIVEAASFCQECGTKTGAAVPKATATVYVAPTMPTTPAQSSSENDKLMAILSHLGGIFFGFIPALIVFLVKNESPGWVLDNAREALNWQITVFIAGLLCFVLMFVLIGILLFWMLMLANLVFCILATVKASNRQPYRYPLSLRLLK